MPIIDFHTHAFPDALAVRVISQLEAAIKDEPVQAQLDGRIVSLLRSMDTYGIDRSVVASIATRPEQFAPILKWSKQIRSERLIPFLSVHPDDPQAVDCVRRTRAEGFPGIKLHPYYQAFDVDEARLFPIYEAMETEGLILLVHGGFDPGFDRERKADPVRVARVLEAFPALRVVAAHFGAWSDWDEVRRHLLGKAVYLDLAFMLQYMSPAEATQLILAHPPEYVLFGSDSPWSDQGEALDLLRGLQLETSLLDRILGQNAEVLLSAAPSP